MKATTPWITYRTRFLVKAKQLTTSLAFTDVLGRQHSGRKGDYLVESSDGVLRIAPRQIFEDIYVPLLADQPLQAGIESAEISAPLSTRGKKRNNPANEQSAEIPLVLLPRKGPQPDRSRGNLIAGLNSL
jgi:hypothetical protein